MLDFSHHVVTNITSSTAAWLYNGPNCARGQAENLINRHKSELASDRTGCRSPLANQMWPVHRCLLADADSGRSNP